MNLSPVLMLIATISLAWTLSACGSTTPGRAAPTPQNSDSVDLELTQELVSADGTVTLNIPTNWSMQSIFPATLAITSDAALISSEATQPTSGQVVMVISAYPRDITELAMGIPLTEIAKNMVGATSGGDENALGEPNVFKIDSSDAVGNKGVLRLQGSEAGIYLLVVDMTEQDTFVSISVNTAPGEQDRYVNLVEKIVRTITVDRSAAADG